ncbi:TOBE domain-containing protein [Actinomarinicola tropica]
MRVHAALPVGLVAEITPASAADLALAEGSELWVSVKATEVVAYPR